MDQLVFEIYNIYISEHGIKPNELEKLLPTDDMDVCISKFINWYIRAYEFAIYDPRDYIGFERINDKFINITIKNTRYKQCIENNLFIINMLEYIKAGTPYNVSYPDYIVNVINIKNINGEIVEFDISNMIGSIILHNIQFKFPLNINMLQKYIFDKIKIEKNLYISNQIKILYENQITDNTNLKL